MTKQQAMEFGKRLHELSAKHHRLAMKYWRPWITKERIDEAVVHCKLADHGVMNSHGLQDAAFLIADFAEWEYSKANALEFESRTQVQAMGLVEQVAASKGLKLAS